ncbi:MAG: 16S rRNA (guanine(527)-N(7))-methyltransferase RsmG [Dehalococcoidia bacterium]|nr:16S rRNA (guanine(527)-N(7))-methyltransferase RsmG [Dehalococcoidia bacterium]
MTLPPPSSPSDHDASELRAALANETTRLGVTLSDTQRDTFARYYTLLLDHNERAGLTAITEATAIAHRLFGESLALLVALRTAGYLTEGQPTRIADIGPGGGFPGLPMRIAEPALQLVLIESQRRRCEFLETAASELALDTVEVVNARAEDAGRDPALRETFDLVVVRAVAPLAVLVEYALPLLRIGGILATPKGSRANDERAEAQPAITALGGVELDPLPLSLPPDLPPQQVILVRREGPLDDRYPRRAGMPSKRPIS